MENNNTLNQTPKDKKRRKIVLFSCLGVAIIFILLIVFVFTKPKVVRFTNLMGATYIEDVTIDKDGKIVAPKDPKLTGWDFVGWCTDKSLEVLIDIDTYEFKTSTTLYAKWILHRYTITYVANDGTLPTNSPSSPMAYYCDECDSLIIESGKCPGCDREIDIANKDDENRTYIKKYVYVIKHQDPVDSTWTFDFDYSGKLPVFIEQNANLGVSLVTPTRTNYTFLGWYDNPEFEGEPLTRINVVNPEDLTLYAKWE